MDRQANIAQASASKQPEPEIDIEQIAADRIHTEIEAKSIESSGDMAEQVSISYEDDISDAIDPNENPGLASALE